VYLPWEHDPAEIMKGYAVNTWRVGNYIVMDVGNGDNYWYLCWRADDRMRHSHVLLCGKAWQAPWECDYEHEAYMRIGQHIVAESLGIARESVRVEAGGVTLADLVNGQPAARSWALGYAVAKTSVWARCLWFGFPPSEAGKAVFFVGAHDRFDPALAAAGLMNEIYRGLPQLSSQSARGLPEISWMQPLPISDAESGLRGDSGAAYAMMMGVDGISAETVLAAAARVIGGALQQEVVRAALDKYCWGADLPL